MTVTGSLLVLMWVAIAVLALLIIGVIKQMNLLTSMVRQSTAVTGGRSDAGPVRHLEPVDAPIVAGLSYDTTRSNLLVFVAEGCRTCSTLVPAVLDTASRHRNDVTVTFVAAAGAQDVVAAAARASQEFSAVDSVEAFRDFHVRATPAGVLIDADGVMVASAPLGSPDTIQRLFEAAAAANPKRNAT